MATAPRSTAAFDELLAALAEARDNYALSEERGFDEIEAVEAYRYILHMVSESIDLIVDADPERPRFTCMVSPSRKYLGDNPDSMYYQATIRDDRAYRIKGRKDHQTYVSFTVHGADPAGGINGPILYDINDNALDVGADGSFEFTLGPLPGARYVFVRNYFLRERSVQTNPDTLVYLEIDPVDDPGASPALDDATFSTRLRDAAALIHATTLGLRVFGQPSPNPVPFVSNEPNTVGTPWSFRNSNIDAAGAVDIYYSSGNFELEPGQALVMEGTLPPSRFTNVMIWNVHMQTFEYRSHQTSLNNEQMVTDENGHYRIVISGTDPGVPNWIDTCGQRRGTIFWRFLLPEEQPEHPRCKVVSVSELKP